MSSVFVSNMTEFDIQLIVNGNEIGTLPAARGPGQPPQPTAFSFSASGGADFAVQNLLELSIPALPMPQIYRFGIDPDLSPKADVQLLVYQGFLTLSEPSGVHMVTALPPPSPPD